MSRNEGEKKTMAIEPCPFEAMLNLLDLEFEREFPSVKGLEKPQPTYTYLYASERVSREVGDSKEGAFYADIRSNVLADIVDSSGFHAPECASYYANRNGSMVRTALDMYTRRYEGVDRIQKILSSEGSPSCRY